MHSSLFLGQSEIYCAHKGSSRVFVNIKKTSKEKKNAELNIEKKMQTHWVQRSQNASLWKKSEYLLTLFTTIGGRKNSSIDDEIRADDRRSIIFLSNFHYHHKSFIALSEKKEWNNNCDNKRGLHLEIVRHAISEIA